MREFFGRDDLLSTMKSLWNKRVPSLVTCRGRRRVGKSMLISEFARRSGARLIKLEGLRPKPGLSNEDQLKYFISRPSRSRRTRPAMRFWISASTSSAGLRWT